MTLSSILVFIIIGIVGGLPVLYLLISLPAIIIYKIYRKIHYGISIMD